MHVDDETGFLESTKQILEMKAPVRVYASASVEEAKEILKTKKVDVIVSDYQMPIENGLEFLKELRETNVDTPFILFTGRGREEVAIEALNIGADGYFNKFGTPATVYGQLMHAIFSCVKAKHAEDDLLKFKTISDSAGYGVMLIDLDGTILYVNESLAKMHGYAVKDLVSKNHSIIHTKDEYMRVESSKQELFDKGYLVMEENHLKKDGSLIPVLSNVTLIRDQKGSPSFVAVIITDITELKESEKRIRNTLDNMLEGCQIIDYDWRYLYVNDAVAKHGRTTKENLLGKTMMEAYPGIETTKMFSVLKKCMKERTSENIENKFTYPDGEKGWFELRIQQVPEGLFILSIDITDRKKVERELMLNEEKYRYLFENMLNAFAYCEIVLDDTGKPVDFVFLEINDSFEKILGLKRENVVGKRVSEAIPGTIENHPKVIETYGRVALTGKEEQFDLYFKPLDVWLHISVYCTKKGYFAAVFENITERKEAEEKLKQSEEWHRAVFENTGTAMCIVDEDGTYSMVNREFEELVGYSQEELKKKKWTDFVSKNDLERLKKIRQAVWDK